MTIYYIYPSYSIRSEIKLINSGFYCYYASLHTFSYMQENDRKSLERKTTLWYKVFNIKWVFCFGRSMVRTLLSPLLRLSFLFKLCIFCFVRFLLILLCEYVCVSIYIYIYTTRTDTADNSESLQTFKQTFL